MATGWASFASMVEHRASTQAKYEEALRIAPEDAKKQRAVYYANLAACHLKTKHFEDAVQDSTAALELQPEYVKALLRRAAAYEELDDLEHALADNTKVSLSPTLHIHGMSTITPIWLEGICSGLEHALPAAACLHDAVL